MLAQIDGFFPIDESLDQADIAAGEDVVPIAGKATKKCGWGVDICALWKGFLKQPPECLLQVPARITAGKVMILQSVFALILLLELPKFRVNGGILVCFPIAIVQQTHKARESHVVATEQNLCSKVR